MVEAVLQALLIVLSRKACLCSIPTSTANTRKEIYQLSSPSYQGSNIKMAQFNDPAGTDYEHTFEEGRRFHGDKDGSE
jgi:hypothetical protein